MTETPKISFSRFQTITHTDKLYKNRGTSGPKTDRKFSRSALMNPDSILSTTINASPQVARDVSLPRINEERKKKKNGSFLESWLDEALGFSDPTKPETPPEKRDSIDGGILKTLKKFELDKRYLQSQNIPAQKIQRLYQSLYIYTHGINQVFKDLLQFVKEVENNDLLGNFWKAFTKLLEGCTSYQTVFQSIEKDHLGNIQRLRNTITVKYEEFSVEKKDLQDKIVKLEKQLEDKDHKMGILKSEFKVMESTLGLTDEAFNEQVNLRLKFEQKINSVYTAYEQLKAKYSKLVEEVSIKSSDMQQQQNKINQIRNLMVAEKIKVGQLMNLLQLEKEKVKDRQTEITIKKTELDDLKESLQGRVNKEDQAMEMMEIQISKYKGLKVQVAELNNVIAGQKKTMKQQQQQISKLNTNMEELKTFNNSVYDQFIAAGKEIVTHQSTIKIQNDRIKEQQNSIMQKGSEICDLNREINHLRGEKETLTDNLEIRTQELEKTHSTMQKNSKTLQEMKAVKDKYERINQILEEQLRNLQKLYNNQLNQISLKVEEIEGLKLMLDSKNKALTQYEKQIEQERETQKVKVQALNSTINKKQSLILEYQKNKEKYDDQLVVKENQIKDLEKKSALLESEKIKLEIQLSGKQKAVNDLEQMLDAGQVKFKNLSERLEGQLREKDTIGGKLQSTEFVLQTKTSEDSIQVKTLNSLLEEYKQKLAERGQYIHPMIYEESLALTQRAEISEKIWRQQYNKFKIENDKLKKESGQLHHRIDELQAINDQLQKLKSNSSEEMRKLKQEGKKYEKSLSTIQNQNKLVKNKLEEIQKNQKALSKNLKTAEQKLKENEQLIERLKENIQQLETQNRRPTTKQSSKSKDSTLQKPAPEKIAVETQTDPIEQPQKEEQEKKITEQVVKVQTNEQAVQTQFFYGEVQTIEEEKMEPKMVVNQKKSQPKKIQSKQFQKALKLTYMRR